MQFTKLGSKNQLIKLNKWKDGKDSVWNFVVDEIKLNQQLIVVSKAKDWHKTWWRSSKICEEILKLQKTIQHQNRHTKKPLSEVSRQQQYNRKQVATTVNLLWK